MRKNAVKVLSAILAASLMLGSSVDAFAYSDKPAKITQEQILVDQNVVEADKLASQYLNEAKTEMENAEKAVDGLADAYQGVIDDLGTAVEGAEDTIKDVVDDLNKDIVENYEEIGIEGVSEENGLVDNTEAVVAGLNGEFATIAGDYNVYVDRVKNQYELLDVSAGDIKDEVTKDAKETAEAKLEEVKNDTVTANKAAKEAAAQEAIAAAEDAKEAYDKAASDLTNLKTKAADLQAKIDAVTVMVNEDISALYNELYGEGGLKDQIEAAEAELDAKKEAYMNAYNGAVSAAQAAMATANAKLAEAKTASDNAKTASENAEGEAEKIVAINTKAENDLIEAKSTYAEKVAEQKSAETAYNNIVASVTNQAVSDYNTKLASLKKAMDDAYEEYDDLAKWRVAERAYWKIQYEMAKSDYEDYNKESVKNGLISDRLKATDEFKALSNANSELSYADSVRIEKQAIVDSVNKEIMSQDKLFTELAEAIANAEDKNQAAVDFLADLKTKLETRENESSADYNEYTNDLNLYTWATDEYDFLSMIALWGDAKEVKKIKNDIADKYANWFLDWLIGYDFMWDSEDVEDTISTLKTTEGRLLESAQLSKYTANSQMSKYQAAIYAAKAAQYYSDAAAKQQLANNALNNLEAAEDALNDLYQQLADAKKALESFEGSPLEGSTFEAIKLAEVEDLNKQIKQAEKVVAEAKENYEAADEAAKEAKRLADEFVDPTNPGNDDEPTGDDPEDEPLTPPSNQPGNNGGTVIRRVTPGATQQAAAPQEVVLTENETPLADATKIEAEGEKEEPKPEVTVVENETPLAGPVTEEAAGFNWWWLLLLAAGLVVGSYEIYKKYSAKAENKTTK